MLLKYKLYALSRHGVHSPFVYDFIEEVLNKKTQKSFEEQLITYFKDHTIIWDDWRLNEEYSENTVIAIRNIHQTKNQTEDWNNLKNNSSVQLSIDLYDYGLLFFKNEFVERQHFTLKKNRFYR